MSSTSSDVRQIAITPEAVQAVAQQLLENYDSEYANDFDWTEFAGVAAVLLEKAKPFLRVTVPEVPAPPPPHPRNPEIIRKGW